MRRLKFAVRIILGIFAFCEVIRGLNFIYVTDSIWERILWHNFYEDQGKIDTIFLGTSHVYCDINPFLLDEQNGNYNFNLASSGQLMNGTYYLLKEADKNNELSHVYIELYYYFNTKEYYNNNREPMETEHFRNWYNTDNMRFSLNKLAYLFSITDDVEEYPNHFFKFIRYRSHADDLNYINDTIKSKREDGYVNFEHSGLSFDDEGKVRGETEYRKKGYWYTTVTLQEKEKIYEQENVLSKQPMASTSEKYLRKVLGYCQNRNIPVTLFIAPVYELQLISTENYDNYVNQVRDIADEYEVDFYDFNLAKENYLPIQQKEYFFDVGHLNAAGAEIFTSFFNQIVSGNIVENREYFYDSYEQKLQNQKPEVYGIYDRKVSSLKNDGKVIRNMWIASNRESGMEYKIVIAPSDGEKYVLQDFNENKQFAVNIEENGICTIQYRLKNTSELTGTISIEY